MTTQKGEEYSISNYLWEASQGNIDFLHNAAKKLRESGAKLSYITYRHFHYVRVVKPMNECHHWGEEDEVERQEFQLSLCATSMFPRVLDHDVLALRLGHWLNKVHEEVFELSSSTPPHPL